MARAPLLMKMKYIQVQTTTNITTTQVRASYMVSLHQSSLPPPLHPPLLSVVLLSPSLAPVGAGAGLEVGELLPILARTLSTVDTIYNKAAAE
jgi:hypothetical protein